jgi:dolichol-phosphate mannosyltransferase
MTMQNLFVIVPVYNEESNIQALFDAFSSLHKEFSGRFNMIFILVDDGSQDKTVEVARTFGIGLRLDVLAHGVNKGPGAAFATAFSSLAGRLSEADWVITMEGDNTSRHELIRQMLTRTEEGFDVVLASPYMYGGGFTQTSFLRKLLSSGANLLVRDLLDIRGILTVSSFFRLFRGSAILRMHRVFGVGVVERLGFESMVEMVMKMTMLRLSISEVAMQLDSSRRHGKSKMKIFRTIGGYLALYSRKSDWQAQVTKEIR